MDIFDTENSVISKENMHDGIEFIGEFSEELQKYANRISGSESETACARAIRRRLADETGATVRLEAYKALPLLGRGSVPFFGLWYLLCFVLYFVSFVGNRLAGILLTVLALLVYVAGGIVMGSLYFGKRRMRSILSQKVSYNVVSEYSKNKDKLKTERVFVIADNHDAVLGNYLMDYRLMNKLSHIIVPITAFVFVLFCVLKMAIGTNTSAKITAFAVVPAVIGVIGITTMLLRYSPFEKHAKQNNGVATSVAMATFAYFVEQPDLLPDDVRLVYASFGSENSGHGGSEAFVKAHPEFAGAQVLCLGDIESNDFKIASCNSVRKIHYSTPFVSIIRSAAHEQKTDIATLPTDTLSQKFASIHGYMSDAFARCGNPTATIVAGECHTDDDALETNDLEKLFSITVGTLSKLIRETAAKKNDVAEQKNNSSEMEIHAVVGK